jgi:hypothetical protein
MNDLSDLIVLVLFTVSSLGVVSVFIVNDIFDRNPRKRR